MPEDFVDVCNSYLTIHVVPLQLTFEAINRDNKRVDTRLGVEVQIKDANDNRPIFAEETVEMTVLESTEQGKFNPAPQQLLFIFTTIRADVIKD